MVGGGAGALAPLPPERSLNMSRCVTVGCKKSGLPLHPKGQRTAAFRLWQGLYVGKCGAAKRGTPCSSTAPTVRKDPKTTILSAGSAAALAAASAASASAWVLALLPGRGASACQRACRSAALAARAPGKSVKYQWSTSAPAR